MSKAHVNNLTRIKPRLERSQQPGHCVHVNIVLLIVIWIKNSLILKKN